MGGANGCWRRWRYWRRWSGEYRTGWSVWRGLPDSHGHEEAQRGLCLDRGALARPEILVGVEHSVGCTVTKTLATLWVTLAQTSGIRRCANLRRTLMDQGEYKGR